MYTIYMDVCGARLSLEAARWGVGVGGIKPVIDVLRQPMRHWHNSELVCMHVYMCSAAFMSSLRVLRPTGSP